MSFTLLRFGVVAESDSCCDRSVECKVVKAEDQASIRLREYLRMTVSKIVHRDGKERERERERHKRLFLFQIENNNTTNLTKRLLGHFI